MHVLSVYLYLVILVTTAKQDLHSRHKQLTPHLNTKAV